MRLYMYRIISLYREKSQVFWCLIFPIILGTFFHIAFSELRGIENISNIPVAIVEIQQSEMSSGFIDLMNEMEQETDYLEITYTSLEDATKMLHNNEVDGIIVLDEYMKLHVKEQGLNQSILKIMSDEYLQTEKALHTITQQNPLGLEGALQAMVQKLDVNMEISLGSGNLDIFSQYFFALIAMACMFGSYFGLENVTNLQANLSPLGARRCVAPTSKMKVVITDFLAAATVHYLNILVLIAYLVFILNIKFGNQIAPILLISFAGSLAGVSLGSMVASVSRMTKQHKEGLLTIVSLLLSFLSGLMVQSMQDIIEHNLPILNRINPAALIKDAFYCLSIYDNYDSFFVNVVSLLLISIIMCAISIFIMRREKYDSI